jgi:6-phosphogluconolactonase (cycloisomerase 2 family)
MLKCPAVGRRPAALILGAAAAAILALPGSALAAPRGAGTVGHVYLDDNPAGANTVTAFARHADGSLTALPGSPFAAGGIGTGKALGSQGAVQLAEHGRYLLAVDAASSQISVLRVKHDGSLRPVQGGPVASGGVDPVSIAVHGSLVYVVNGGPGGSNYTGFVLRGGHLRPLAGSTVPLPDGSGPGDVLFNGDGTRLVGVRVNPSLIDSFRVDGGGRLHAAPGSPFTAQGLGPFGSEFRPTNPSQLFVTNAHNSGSGTVSAFTDAADGTLSSIGASPFANGQTAPCWLVISHDGSHLYAVNTGSGSISSYEIADSGSLTLLGNTPVAATGGVGATDAGLSPDDGFLYVNESRVDAVGAFAVHGGSLTELSGSPFPVTPGSSPAGIAVN